MQHKILNVYLYRDNSVENEFRYKMRFIEVQNIENCAQDLDQKMIDIYTGVEAPFAMCLSTELDKYKDNPGMPLYPLFKDDPHSPLSDNDSIENEEENLFKKRLKEKDGLFKHLRDTYTREVIRDSENAATYLYQDVDMILFASYDAWTREEYHRGQETDMYCLLGAVDNAVQAFKTNAVNDKYTVNVNISAEPTDFSDKLSIIRHAFKDSANFKHAISRHTAGWIVNNVRSLEPQLRGDYHYHDFLDTAGQLYRVLRNTKEDSLASAILNGWYLEKQDAEIKQSKPNMNTLFSQSIASGIKPLMDSDDLLSTVRKRV